MKFKGIIALVLALVMLLALCACGEKPAEGSTPASTQGGTTPTSALAGTYNITVWVSELMVDLTKEQIKKFNETNTDGIVINATVEPVSEAVAATNMITDVEAGGDIFCFAQDQFARLVQAGALAKLGKAAAEKVTSENSAGVVAAGKAGDDLYAYPLTADNGYFMYYDKSVIPDADVDSLEKLVKDCENAKKYFAFEANSSAWYLASWFFATGCVCEWTTDSEGNFVSVNDTFNSPNGLISVKGMKKLVDSEYHLSSSKGSEFASGAAIVVTGIWDYETVKNILGDNMGVTDLPSFTVDGKEYHLGSFAGCKLMGVKPQTDATRQAVLHKLAQYLTGYECQMDRFNQNSWGPSNLEAQQSEAVKKNPGLVALFAQSQYAVPEKSMHGSWWDIGKVIADDVKAATDEAGLQAALDNYYNKINALFSLTGYIFVGAWNGWSNSDTSFSMENNGGIYSITVDVPQSDYMGGRIVTAGTWE
ncbi:MAG: extracellular solute-binding protein, partial [Clostridia bacterium]|nr:extracellular solute-binding protein [Clostridia bacterium]